MEMATASTSIAAETTHGTIFEPIERNENGKRRRRSEAPAAPSDWRSRMERMIRQQAQELTQLHRTVGHLAILRGVQAAREEAQWQGIMAWIQEREQKWDAHHEDDKLWGAGITNMIAMVFKGVAPGQEGREKEREVIARTDCGGLEASNMQTRREKRDQRNASSCSRNRSPNSSSNCRLTCSLRQDQSQQPHPRDGGRPSNPEPRVSGCPSAQAQAPSRRPDRAW